MPSYDLKQFNYSFGCYHLINLPSNWICNAVSRCDLLTLMICLDNTTLHYEVHDYSLWIVDTVQLKWNLGCKIVLTQ